MTRGTVWLVEPGYEYADGIRVRDERGAALTVHLADQLQEQFFPESSGSWDGSLAARAAG